MPGRKVTGKKSCPYPDGMIEDVYKRQKLISRTAHKTIKVDNSAISIV